jgi:predicted ATPase
VSHIIKFSVAGLAGRDKPYSHKLDRHVNIFFGENGSGKTSLLKVLHSAISGDAAVLERVPFSSASVDVYSLSYKKEFHREIKADRTPLSQDVSLIDTGVNWKDIWSQNMFVGDVGRTPVSNVKYIFKSPPSWSIDPHPKPDFSGGFADRYLPTSRVYQDSATSQVQFSGSSLSEAQLDAYFAESIKQLWNNYSADIARGVSQAQQKGLANILKAVLSTEKLKRASAAEASTAYSRVSAFLSRQPSFSNVLGTVEEFSKRYQADPRLKKIVSDIDIVEREIETAAAPRELLKTLIGKMFSRKVVRFTEKTIEVETDNHVKIELSALSSGERQLLRIFIETLLAGENTILIDEPELSMHIDWQRSLVQAMRQLNPKAQIILATHSPEIMSEVKEDLIFRL